MTAVDGPATLPTDRRADEPLISARGISKSFGGHQVLHDVSLDVRRGEAVCLLGRSGSGKSTFLRCLNLLERAERGIVMLDGDLLGHHVRRGRVHRLPARREAVQRQQLGMVFQQFNLFAHKTVLENVIEAPVKVAGRSRREARADAVGLLERVGLAEKVGAYPGQLSGGQQQRVAIARALAMKPKVLLFDEPTSALDPEMVNEVLQVIRDLVVGGMTTIIVTHEVGFAREVCDRFVFLQDGRIVEEGPASRLNEGAEHAATRDFLSKVL
ncbi:amino acid ABC transporter ATP-binding protein [Nocardioides carbamazepini]|uniref:amino acid ABC transporter ATP-binding protein n=1 Tax=Nocardioides carbamazepini TaxID=2854259 RepID=UPI002149C1B0|nr:amino acid ABC transporter ATP-binding protein [Nocardioides carbamazepini]MCR1783875.1 amino acid ABC transporter ATP-binding protein [Nocardioides carbamazepini]